MAFTKAGLWGPDAVLDSAGHPQPGATAAVYLSDGVTLAGLWTSSAKSVVMANPTQADIHGNLHFYADPGPYVLKVTVGGTVTTLTVEVPIDPGEAAQDQDVVAAQAAAEAYADGIVAAALAAALAASQPLDADLTAIAALATTNFGRALLILADAAALRTAAGLGTAATHAVGDFDAAGTAAAAVAAVVAGAPGALDTLNELATALADDANFATTVTNALATKVIAGATSGTANQAALPAAVAHTHEMVKTDDGGVYLSTGSSWVEVVPPSLKLAPTAVKTVNYTAAVGDYVQCDTSGGIFTVTLPTAPADKTSIAVDLVASGNTLTIARGGADVFQKAGGPTALTMNTANRVLVLQYQSATAVWHVQDHLPAVINTKGDLLTYGTERARLAVGADGALLGADSTQATGLKWIPSGTYASLRQTHAVLTMLRRGVEDVNVLVAGDSTSSVSTAGGAPVRWTYQLAQLLAADYGSTFTTIHSQWDDTAKSYPAPTVVQPGPNGVRTDAATGSAASNVITDTSTVSGDAGKRVFGANIPPGARVGTATAGASFTLVDRDGAILNPLGAVTSVTLSADPVLSFWNASVGGSRWLYGFGQYAHQMYGVVRPHLILANHGHNEVSVIATGAPSNGKTIFRMDYLCGTEMLTELCPAAAVILMGQNPRTDSRAADEPVNGRLIAEVAAERGYGFVDIYQLFVDHGTWAADWMSDALHPNTTGYAAWAAEVHKLFVVTSGVTPIGPTRSLFLQPPTEQLVADGLLLDWPASGLPSGWTVTAATATLDTTTFPGVTALKIINSDASGGHVQIPLDVNKVGGQWVTATIRTRYDAGVDVYENGGLAIHWIDANGQAVRLSSDNPSQLTNGLHFGFGAWFYQSISAYIPDGVTSAHIWLWGDLLGSSNPTYVRRLVVQRGRQPAGDLPLPTPKQLVTGSVTDVEMSSSAAVAPSKVSGLGPYLANVVGALFSGAAGNYYSTPSVAANQITGTIELRAKLGAGTGTRATSGLPGIISKWTGSGTSGKAYRLNLAGSGMLQFQWVDSGLTAHALASVSSLAATLTSDLWVRVQFDPATGTATFATSPDNVTWTNLGAAQVFGATSINNCSSAVEVGSAFSGSAGNFIGTIEQAEIATAFGGAAVVSWVLPSAGATSWAATTGETWTLNGYVPTAYGVAASLLTAADAATLASSATRLTTPIDRAMIAAPAGAVAVTYDRMAQPGSSSTLALPAAGTSLIVAMPCTRTATAGNALFRTGDTGGAGTTGNVHQWVALLDSTGKVVAVTADKLLTSMTGSSKFTWAFLASIGLTAGSLYYWEILLRFDTTMPQIRGINSSITSSEAPITCGAGSTGNTTPPAVGDTRTLPSAASSTLQFAWLT